MKYKLRARAVVEWTYELDSEDAGYDEPIPIEQLIQDDMEGIGGEWWAYIPEAAFDDDTPPEGLVVNEFVIEDGSKPRPALLLMPDGTIHEVERASDEIEAGTPAMRWQIVGIKTCPDCGVVPGQRHRKGCDVARCHLCGWQALQCDDHGLENVPSTLWTGEWPGTAECREMGLWRSEGVPDLNQLATLAAEGHLVWSPSLERWVRP